MIACVKLRQLDIDENYALRGHTLARAIEVCVHSVLSGLPAASACRVGRRTAATRLDSTMHLSSE